MNNNELYHYGVLGMKWGHRKNKNYNGPTLTIGTKKHNIELGLRAMKTKGASERKAAANAKVSRLNKKAPGSKRYVKAKIKATKINASRYGKTNSRLLTEGVLKTVGVAAISNVATRTAYKLGKTKAAAYISSFGTGATAATAINTAIRIGANYRDKRRKNK